MIVRWASGIKLGCCSQTQYEMDKLSVRGAGIDLLVNAGTCNVYKSVRCFYVAILPRACPISRNV